MNLIFEDNDNIEVENKKSLFTGFHPNTRRVRLKNVLTLPFTLHSCSLTSLRLFHINLVQMTGIWPHLQTLFVHFCHNLTSLDIVAPHLNTVRLISNQHLTTIPNAPDIADLIIEHCSMIRTINITAPNLHTLRIHGCDTIESCQILGNNLNSAILHDNPRLFMANFNSPDQYFLNVRNCPLRVLNIQSVIMNMIELYHTDFQNDRVIMSILNKNPQLETVDIRGALGNAPVESYHRMLNYMVTHVQQVRHTNDPPFTEIFRIPLVRRLYILEVIMNLENQSNQHLMESMYQVLERRNYYFQISLEEIRPMRRWLNMNPRRLMTFDLF